MAGLWCLLLVPLVQGLSDFTLSQQQGERYRGRVILEGVKFHNKPETPHMGAQSASTGTPEGAVITYPTTCQQLHHQSGGKLTSGYYELYTPDVYEEEQQGFHMKSTKVFCDGDETEDSQQTGEGWAELAIPDNEQLDVQRRQNDPGKGDPDVKVPGKDPADEKPITRPTDKPAGPVSYARDCADIFMYYIKGDPRFKSGVYIVYNPSWNYLYPGGVILLPIYVYCDMETTGGGWTVFQRRANKSVNFDRNWKEYETGFGDLGDDFWFGLKLLSLIVQGRRNTLQIDLYGKNTKHWYVRQGNFNVSDSADNYKLWVSYYSGETYSSYGTYLQNYANGGVFWTADTSTYHNSTLKAGFWCTSLGHYSRCGNPNGVPGGSGYSGLWWGSKIYQFTNATMSFKPDYY